MLPEKRKKLVKWLRTSVWAFPTILFVILLLLTAFRISGTSEGTYHEILYGENSHDPNLLYGQPRSVRSDEWTEGTQEVVAQSKSGFHAINPLMGTGHDVTLQSEIPSTDWSELFKPQTWSFFILPIEYAFAFKWWLIMYLLIISCYFFTLRMLEDRRLSTLFSLAIGISPFALWWYQTNVFMGLAYGFFILLLGMKVLDGEPIRFIKNRPLSNTLYVASLTFVGTCFGLLLYPPFQIPIAIIVVAYLLGYFLHKRYGDKATYKLLLRRLGLLVIGAVIAGILGLAFFESHKAAINSLDHTVYPGARTIHSGDLPMLNVFDAFLMPVLQSDMRAGHFFTNQSEASNFILLLPFLLIPGFILLWYENKKQKRIDWLLLVVQLCGLMFLVRAFVPYGNIFYKLLLLQKVPNARLLIGMGFVGILQFVIIINRLGALSISRQKLTTPTLLYGLSCFIALLWTGFFVRIYYPMFVHRWSLIILLALAFTAIIIALLAKRPALAIFLFLLFSAGSSFHIIPLYRGLGFVTHSPVAQAIDRISSTKDVWGTVDAPYFENMGILAGRKSITGIQIYPDLNFWKQVGGKKYQDIYNREGHVILSTDPNLGAPIRLTANNAFAVQFGCTKFIEHHVNFVVATHPLQYRCTQLIDTVSSYPHVTFYLYRINP